MSKPEKIEMESFGESTMFSMYRFLSINGRNFCVVHDFVNNKQYQARGMTLEQLACLNREIFDLITAKTSAWRDEAAGTNEHDNEYPNGDDGDCAYYHEDNKDRH